MDAKDILGLPQKALLVTHEKKVQQKKDSQRKPEGVSREVYALTGGLPPLMPSINFSQLKWRQPSDEKISWQWLPFTNSARKDNLHLYHWVRVVNGVAPTGDYSFAKYNKIIDVVKYTNEEYEKYLVDPLWTKDETDQLFDLCERYDLRFIVIADRFPSSRTVEELKERYYSVSRALLIARASSPADIAGHPIIKEPYYISQEIERKRLLSLALSQTKQQERKDAEVLFEAKRIMESRMIGQGSEDSILPVESNDAAITPSTSAMGDSACTLVSLRMLHVYLRTYALEQMVQTANSSLAFQTIRRVEQTLLDLGVSLKLRMPTKAVCVEFLELRKEIVTLLNLQKKLHFKEFECSSLHESSHADLPVTCQPSHHQEDQTFLPESICFGGEKAGKRDQKRKGPGRLSEAPSSAHKRPRKLKASDL